jgi:hypothetical protein
VNESNPYASTGPDEPCKCGKRMLKTWWGSVTDAGQEGTDNTRHSRVACTTGAERRAARATAQPDTRTERERMQVVIDAARGVEACFSGVGPQLVLAKPGRELEDRIGDLRAALAVLDRMQNRTTG